MWPASGIAALIVMIAILALFFVVAYRGKGDE